MPSNSPPDGNGHGNLPAGLKTPAPHPAPSLAAQMAEADAQAAAAANAQLHGQIAAMLEDDPASLLMNLPALFGAALAEIVAAGVQAGIERAAQVQQQPVTPAEAAARKPFLLAQTGNVRMAAEAAMTGMPPPGVPPA